MTPEAALPGSYGIPPLGYRLPEGTRLGAVHLAVTDPERSTEYYERTVGLIAREIDASTVALHAEGDASPLVVLVPVERPATPTPAQHLGLYHFALRLPSRTALGRFFRHLMSINESAGAADHLVSEAFYLTDPDGNGIEIYADRPREMWQRIGREIRMATLPIDQAGLQHEAGSEPWGGAPHGTTMGHVHLHVGTLMAAGRFYVDGLGFDLMSKSFPGALFLATGGYHHHVGLNTWAGPGAGIPDRTQPRLLSWSLTVPTAEDVRTVADNLVRAGFNDLVRWNPDVNGGRQWRAGGRTTLDAFSCPPEQATALMALDPWRTAVNIQSAN